VRAPAESLSGKATLRVARSIVTLGGAEVLGKLGTLGMTVAAARLLPLHAFGVFSVALSAGLLGAVVCSAGLDTQLTQRTARSPARAPLLLGEVLALRLVVGGVGLAAVAAGGLATGAPADVLAAVLCVLAACLVETCTEAYRAVALATGRTGLVAAALLLQRSATTVAVVGALLVRPVLLAAAAAYLAGTLAGAAVAAAGLRRAGIRPRYRGARWRAPRLLRRSWSAGLHSAASMALFRSDVVLLAALSGAAAAGRYAAAYRLVETVTFVAWTVSRAVFPAMAVASGPAPVRRAVERATAVSAAVLLPYGVLLSLRGDDVLRLLYGTDFDAGLAVTWLAPAPLLFATAFLACGVLLAPGTTPVVLVGSAGALAVNVGLNLLLVPSWGPTGAAAATSLSYAAEIALLYPAVRRALGRARPARAALPAAVACVPVAVVLLLPIPLLAALMAASGAYAAGWVALARLLDAEQVDVARALVTRAAT
jgi:O-antigen/teichoic acid export membrane protein